MESLDVLMQRFGPTLHKVRSHYSWAPGRHVVLVRREVEKLAEDMQLLLAKEATKQLKKDAKRRAALSRVPQYKRGPKSGSGSGQGVGSGAGMAELFDVDWATDDSLSDRDEQELGSEQRRVLNGRDGGSGRSEDGSIRLASRVVNGIDWGSDSSSDNGSSRQELGSIDWSSDESSVPDGHEDSKATIGIDWDTDSSQSSSDDECVKAKAKRGAATQHMAHHLDASPGRKGPPASVVPLQHHAPTGVLPKSVAILARRPQGQELQIFVSKDTARVKREATGEVKGAKQPAWQQFTDLGGTATLENDNSSMWQLLVERSLRDDKKSAGPWLQELTWERKRKDPSKQAPATMGDLLRFGCALANDYAIKSKAQATWRTYSSWYGTFETFCAAFCARDSWEDRVFVLRVSVALMSQVYALGTLSIYTSAVSCFWKLKGWRSPWEDILFKATFGGITRELGKAVKKQPGLNAAHFGAIFGLEGTPIGWTEVQWIQAKALMFMGWELFNRRQDFGRLQPCDLRFSQNDEVLEVLIRYAKNDVKGQTRAPKLVASDSSEVCPVQLLRQYMAAANIVVADGCDKQWGQPFACSVCEPLFPSILSKAKGGKRPRAMPDSRVTKIIKDVMMTVAESSDEQVLTRDEAKAFSAKSMRCGGCSQAAAEGVRDGIVQGHGGWLSRTSLVHYDFMQKHEETFTSQKLSAAVLNLVRGKKKGTESGDEDTEVLDRNERLSTMRPDAGGNTSDEDSEKRWGVIKISSARWWGDELQYKVLWEETQEAGRGEETWESAQTLQDDGMAPKIAGFWRSNRGRAMQKDGFRLTPAGPR